MTTFRRSYAFSIVAALLIVLAVSPVTAPFSVLRFAGPHSGASVLHRPGQPLRAGAHSIVFASNVDGRTAILRLVESPVRFLDAAFDCESIFFAVLRI